ncbi:MAG: DUF4446 family protein [Candidatus Moraniibacteriota bacterium]
MSQMQLILLLASVFLGFLGLVLGIISLVKLSRIKAKLSIFFAGKDASNLETVLLNHSKELGVLDKEIQELFEISNRIHTLALKSIHKVGIVRFNPFKDFGGDQSFALALLDGKDCGLVISSLHTREGTRIYSKPVAKGISEKYTLTAEEETAIKEATTLKPSRI